MKKENYVQGNLPFGLPLSQKEENEKAMRIQEEIGQKVQVFFKRENRRLYPNLFKESSDK